MQIDMTGANAGAGSSSSGCWPHAAPTSSTPSASRSPTSSCICDEPCPQPAPPRIPADGFQWRGEHLAIELEGATVLFTTRRGGVSEGPYTSLNLGLWTDDAPERVPRTGSGSPGTWACPASASRAARSTARTSVASTARHRAQARGRRRPGQRGADVAADRPHRGLPAGGAGPREAVAMLHCGWRGLAGGIVTEGVSALREIGAEGRSRQRSARARAAAATRWARRCTPPSRPHPGPSGRRLDLKAIARRELEQAGVGDPRRRPVHHLRRSAGCSSRTGATRGHRSPGGRGVARADRVPEVDRVRANLEQVRTRSPPRRRAAVATPQTSRSSRPPSTSGWRRWACWPRPGSRLVGENRAQDLEASSGAG